MADNLPIARVRFYTDMISFQLSRGKAQDNNFDVKATNSGENYVGIKSGGGVEADLFDMRPLNLVTFDTSASATTKADNVRINIDTGQQGSVNGIKNGFIAILNHNMATANAKVRIGSSDSPESNVAGSDGTAMSGTQIALTEIVNADTISTSGSSSDMVVFEPATDGSSIVTFTENDDRYWGINFEGADGDSSINASDGNFGSTDLTVGCILLGEFFDAAPVDVNLTRTIAFDGLSMQESVGGQRYSYMTQHGRRASSTSKSPFITTTSDLNTFGGRMIYDLNMSHVAHDELMPDAYDSHEHRTDSFVGDVWSRTQGSHLPFIFSIDNTHTGADAESSHIFARFGQDDLQMKQVASNRFNFSLRIEEEF